MQMPTTRHENTLRPSGMENEHARMCLPSMLDERRPWWLGLLYSRSCVIDENIGSNHDTKKRWLGNRGASRRKVFFSKMVRLNGGVGV